jgi:glycine/D-amino acid oxidase-like deaminating enzyme
VGYWAGELEAELAEYGMRFYTGLADRAGTDAGVRRVGLLFPALSEPGVEMLRQEHERELGFAPDVAMIDADEALRMAPILSADAIHGALVQPDGHRVDTARVMAVLTSELARAGVDVRTGVAAEEAIVAGGRVAGVRTSAGEIAAGAVVNAAGAAARAIGARNGVDIAAVPLLESRFTTEPIPGVGPDLPMMLFFERDLLYLREQAGGLLVGAIEHEIGPRSRVELSDPPRTADLSDHAAREHEELARGLADVIPALATARVRERASGLPTWTPDGRHILGIAPGIEGYVVLAGCNECCVTHGPGLARIASELVTDGRTDTDISAYRVDRFGDTSDDAIQAAAEGQYLMRHPPEAGVAATPFGIELP